jgi:hypothetical protein
MSAPGEREDELERAVTGADRELEAALSSLAPSRNTSLDPIATAFEAGRRQSRAVLRVWQGASVVSGALAAAVMIVSGVPMREAHPVNHAAGAAPVAVVASNPPSFERPSDQSVLRLQQVVLERGVEALPQAHALNVPQLNVRGVF